jgi:hypothetical protein
MKMRNSRLMFSLCVAPTLYLTHVKGDGQVVVKTDRPTPTNLLFLENKKIESLVIDMVILSIMNLRYNAYL